MVAGTGQDTFVATENVAPADYNKLDVVWGFKPGIDQVGLKHIGISGAMLGAAYHSEYLSAFSSAFGTLSGTLVYIAARNDPTHYGEIFLAGGNYSVALGY